MRIATLKRELVQAIGGLPADTTFNIVAFSSRVGVWQRSLLAATPATKQKAAQFVTSLRPGGETASYDALEAAFAFDIEAVYFLSDGDPNYGKITAPTAIVAAIVKANQCAADFRLHHRHRARSARRSLGRLHAGAGGAESRHLPPSGSLSGGPDRQRGVDASRRPRRAPGRADVTRVRDFSGPGQSHLKNPAS